MFSRIELFKKNLVKDDKYRRSEYCCKLMFVLLVGVLGVLLFFLALKCVYVKYYNKKEREFVTDILVPLIGGGALLSAYAWMLRRVFLKIRGVEPIIENIRITIKQCIANCEENKLILMCSERESIANQETQKQPIKQIPILNATFLYELMLCTESNCSGYIYKFNKLELRYQNNNKTRLLFSEAKYASDTGKTGCKEHVYKKLSDDKEKNVYEIFDNGGEGAYIPILLVIDEREKQEYNLFESETKEIWIELLITVYNRNGRKKECRVCSELDQKRDKRGECFLTMRSGN